MRFTYNKSGTDRYKEAFVLHPNYNGLVHAIDMRVLTQAERLVIETVMDPESRGKTFRIPLINDILRRMDPPTEIERPQMFYVKFVKPFLRDKNAYRTYHFADMLAVQLIDKSKVHGPTTGTPLFGNKPVGSIS